MNKGRGKPRSESAGLRQQAEKQLHDRKPALEHILVGKDTSRLVHELEVHKIELEMQNAALSQSRDELESALERYTDLYDFSPAGYFTLDCNGTIRATNLTGSSFLGVERSRLIGQPFALYVATGSRPGFSRFLNQLFTTPGEISCELTLAKKGGSPIIVQLAALTAESGQECRVAVIDITRRKQAEEALFVSENIYRTIGESIDYGIWICAPDGRNIYASKSFLDLVGMSQEECSNFGWGDVLHPDDAEQTIAAWKECVRTGGSWDIEHRYRGTDGEWHDILARGLPVRNEHGEIICWSGINLDISNLKKTEKALRESEERMQQALDISHSFTFDWRLDTDQVQRSSSCRAILKLSEDEAANHTGERFFRSIHPDDRDRCRLILNNLTPAASNYTAEYRIVLNDGSEVVLEETGIGSFSADGKLQRLVGVSTDITARKKVELSLHESYLEMEQRVADRTIELAATVNRLQAEMLEREFAEKALRSEINERLRIVDELREKEQMFLHQSRLAAMGEMISNIAHQWRQPLNTLGLIIQKLLLFYDSPEFNREFFSKNTAEAMRVIQHMSQTINDFRDFFRSDKELEYFKVNDAVKQTVSLVEQGLADLKIAIVFHSDGDPMICGYPNEYAQALLNIVLNARDALIENSVDNALISLHSFESCGSAVLTVSDNGGGVPEKYISRLFDPYFSTKTSEKGTGLGLFIAKTIIEKNMGGSLTVRNIPGGAEFRIEVKHDEG